jgi:hypothetical protein
VRRWVPISSGGKHRRAQTWVGAEVARFIGTLRCCGFALIRACSGGGGGWARETVLPHNTAHSQSRYITVELPLTGVPGVPGKGRIYHIIEDHINIMIGHIGTVDNSPRLGGASHAVLPCSQRLPADPTALLSAEARAQPLPSECTCAGVPPTEGQASWWG